MQRASDNYALDRRFQTPESFRTKKNTEDEKPPGTSSTVGRPEPEVNSAETPRFERCQNQERDMSNPYLDVGFSHPYQISQNRYREQVFGNSRPGMMQHNMKPEPMEQMQQTKKPSQVRPPRPWSDLPTPSSREPRPYPYDYSPRHHQEFYDDRAYRTGRPDIGPQKDNYVPYPQEPINRPTHPWAPPPSIGYQPPGPGNNAKGNQSLEDGGRVDISLEDGGDPHPGWMLLIRFNKEGEDQVQRALYMCQKHIDSDGGRIMGMARPNGVKIREGGDSWVTFGKLKHFGGGVWNPQDSPMQEDTQYCVLAIYYPSLTRAIQWWDRDSMFKQKDFPRPYSADCIALPLSSSVDTGFNKTLVFSEYPKISYAEYFRDKFSVPTEEMMMKRFKASPYVVKTTHVPVDDPKYRVARVLRGSWIKRNSIITVSMFESLSETFRYFRDPDYFEAKKYQDRVSAPTTMVFDLEDWRPRPPAYGYY